MTAANRPWRRPLGRLTLLALLAPLLAAPTPGQVGGCGGAGNEPVRRGDPANAAETAEYMYFDRGLCSFMCLRLRRCGRLCEALDPRPADCDNEDEAAFAQCVRGGIDARVFGVNACVHACVPPASYQGATEWDVQVCGEAVLTRSCAEGGPGSIGTVFTNAPRECLRPCR